MNKCYSFKLHLSVMYTLHVYNSLVLYTNIDQKRVNSLHRVLNCEIGGLDCRGITTEYRTRAHCIHIYHLFCNTLVHVIYSVVSGQYSYIILYTNIDQTCVNSLHGLLTCDIGGLDCRVIKIKYRTRVYCIHM